MKQVKHSLKYEFAPNNQKRKNVVFEAIAPQKYLGEYSTDEKRIGLIIDFYHKLKGQRIDRKYYKRSAIAHFSYVHYLYTIKMAFEKKNYLEVCSGLSSLVHYEPVYQARIKNNVLKLINSYLHIE